jgi:hypothetical protein
MAYVISWTLDGGPLWLASNEEGGVFAVAAQDEATTWPTIEEAQAVFDAWEPALTNIQGLGINARIEDAG